MSDERDELIAEWKRYESKCVLGEVFFVTSWRFMRLVCRTVIYMLGRT